ncbi:MAG TPA: DUF2085 domain-containing protein [Candidatus Aminicenantes bacterium]|nr:DUF2085 domain-containing protein [Candidatus Aminicenantes bacterium]
MDNKHENIFLGKLKIVYFGTLIGSSLLVSLIFLAPYLQSIHNPWGTLIYGLFSPFCHQVPSRCFQLWGHSLAVCGRCTGIYLGFFLGLVIYPFFGGTTRPLLPHLFYLLLFSLPIGLDSLGNFFHLWSTSTWVRLTTGLIWGLILPFYFLYGLSEALAQSGKNK